MGNKNRYKQEVEGSLYVFIEILHIYRNRFAILQTANNEIFKVVQAALSHELQDMNLNTSLIANRKNTRKVYQSCPLFALLKIVLKNL